MNIEKISGPASTSVIRAASSGDVRIVLPEDARVELRERAGRLDPRRPAADDDDVQRAVVDQRRVLVRGLPQAQDVVLEPHCVGERVQREGVVGRALDAEEVDLRAEPEARGSRSSAASVRRIAPRARRGRSPSRGPRAGARCPGRGRGRGSDGRPRAARAGPSRPGTGAAGRCGSRSCRRARRRRRSSSASAPRRCPAKPPPRTRTRGRAPSSRFDRSPRSRYGQSAHASLTPRG